MNLPNKKITAHDVCLLTDIRREISRLNSAAGHTVFNPALTGSLDQLLRKVKS